MNTTLLDPKILGFWSRCVREAQHLSQEALAANASVNTRTIQRFEAGSVSMSNVAGGGPPRVLRPHFVAPSILLQPGDANASIRVVSSLRGMPSVRARICLRQQDRGPLKRERNQLRTLATW
jgi:hypothetical protein